MHRPGVTRELPTDRTDPDTPKSVVRGQAFEGEHRAGQRVSVQVGVHLGVADQELVAAEGDGGGGVGSGVGAFGVEGGPGVVVGEPQRGDLVVDGAGDIEGVSSSCDAVGAGQGRCGDLVDFAGGG